MLTGPLPKQVDHRKLAEERAQLEGTIPVADFSRLKELLTNDSGEVRVRLKFRKGKGPRMLVLGECRAGLEVDCQTCLENMKVGVEVKIRTLLVPTLEELMGLGQSEDGMVCESEQVSLVDIVEDDLIVHLPMVPRHAEGECAAVATMAGAVPETYRPFAGLAKLTEDWRS